MAESLLVRKGGGAKINENLITALVGSGQTITPGTFVNLVKGYVGTLNDPSGTGSDFYRIAKISDTKVAISGRDGGSSNRAYVEIFELQNNTIVKGNRFFLQETESSNQNTSITVLDETRIFVFYKIPDTVFTILSVNGITITGKSTNVLVNNTGTEERSIDCVKVATDKVLICYSEESSSRSLVGHIVTISGTTGTLQTKGTLRSATNIWHFQTRLVNLSTTQTLVITRIFNLNDSSSNMISSIISHSGTSVSASNFTTILSGNISVDNQDPIAMSSTQVYWLYNNDALFPARPYVQLLNISGTSVSVGNTFLAANEFLQTLSIAKPENNKLFLIGRRGSSPNFELVYALLTTSGNSITETTPFTTVLLSTSVNLQLSRLIAFNENKLFGYLSAANGTLPRTLLIENAEVASNATGRDVQGLSKTGGTAGQTVEVFVNE
jgi:hypothetical protein